MRLFTSKLLPLLLMLGLLGFAAVPTVTYAADSHDEAHSSEGGHDDHKAEVQGPLNLVYGEAIWNLLVFLIVLAILAKFVFPVIRDGLKAREAKLEGDLSAAEKAKADAEASVAEYKTKIAEAQKEAQVVIDEAKKSAEQVAMKVKSDAESEIVKMKERATAEIESAKDAALSEVYAQTAELSTQIAGRILKREINADDQQQLVSDSLAELTKSGV
ncbi:MAG: F0F1 ATP synthase subunit B [Phycisphaeraceae bacterium]|nr:F0F1 ATP synthase subunit B [Phycisphaeraceae bacterium]